MTAHSYTNLATVSGYLGKMAGNTSTLTVEQAVTEATLETAVASYIDLETHRSWLAPAITGERYDVRGPEIFLKQAPVTSIQTIHVRTVQVGDPGRDLVSGKDYELIDANLGQVRFANINSDQVDTAGPDDLGSAWIVAEEAEFANALAFVDYTPTGPPVPADITLCATLIVAASLYLAINPDRWGLGQMELAGQASFQFEANGMQIVVPELAQRILHRSTLPIIV